MTTHVNFETAKLLKEKGFGMSNEDYIQLPRFYEEDGNYIEYDVHVGRKYNPHRTHLGAATIDDFEAHLTMMDNSLDGIYLAPTIAEVVMWLYEKHGIWISVVPYNDEELSQILWENKIIHISDYYNDCSDYTFYHSPTEAYQEAINYTLKNLILENHITFIRC